MNLKERCNWVSDDYLYKTYHDTQWGVPIRDDINLFELLILETFQAGLSWITILRKREHFFKAFDGFSYIKIAEYSDEKIQELLENSYIIRNKLKIISTVSNARAFIQVQKEFGSFSSYIWAFVNDKPIQNEFKTSFEVPACTDLSKRIYTDLKKRKFKFIGPKIIYAYMQAVGMVNDHTTNCFRFEQIKNNNY